MLSTVGDGASTEILTEAMLKNYIAAEFAIFIVFLKLICDLKMTQSHGTPFGQYIHDGATAPNKRKYQAFGIQFVDPTWLCNLVICIGFVCLANSLDLTVSAAIERTTLERTLFSLLAICGLMVSDRAALGVSRLVGMSESEACDIHDGDKVGSSATGKLTRSANGTVVNPFPAGRALMSRAHNMGKHFSWTSRIQSLDAVRATMTDVPDISIQLDLNSTRIASEHSLLVSLLRLIRALKVYHVQHPEAFTLEEGDWTQFAEFEAVLNITQVLTKLAQFETKFMAAYGPLVKMMVYSWLCGDSVKVINLDAVTKDPRLPRSDRQVEALSTVGRECRDRAIIEFERRFLGSTSNTRLPVDSPDRVVVINERQLVATLLDLRTCKCPHLTVAQRVEAKAALKKRYVAFYVQYRKFEREKAAQVPDDRSAGAAAEVEAPSPSVKKAKTAGPTLICGFSYGAAEEAVVEGLGLEDDDDEEEEVESPATEEELQTRDLAAAEVEFKKVFKNWLGHTVDYIKEFPQAKLVLNSAGTLDLIEDLMQLDMGALYNRIIASDTHRAQFGFLPLMAGCCDGQIGALNAESYAERVISASDLVMTKGNTLLNDDDLERLVVLRMNRDFMLFMRQHYFAEIQKAQPFNMTVIDDV